MRTQLSTQPVLFIQGAGGMHQPEGSGRLAAYLARELGSGYRVIAPEMPDADNPHYEPWRDQIEQELEAVDEAVILVGHSFGGSVLLKYLAEGSYRQPVRGLFLISVPNWGPDGWAYEEFAVPDDVGSRLPASKIFLYHSRDDPEVPFAHLATRSVYRLRGLGQSTARNTPSFKGFRHLSTTSKTCLAEGHLVRIAGSGDDA
jgi:predicted alpha/beta hydrolase family esterase